MLAVTTLTTRHGHLRCDRCGAHVPLPATQSVRAARERLERFEREHETGACVAAVLERLRAQGEQR